MRLKPYPLTWGVPLKLQVPFNANRVIFGAATPASRDIAAFKLICNATKIPYSSDGYANNKVFFPLGKTDTTFPISVIPLVKLNITIQPEINAAVQQQYDGGLKPLMISVNIGFDTV